MLNNVHIFADSSIYCDDQESTMKARMRWSVVATMISIVV